MRIGCGVAVSGKMLGRGQHAGSMCATNVRAHHLADLLRVGAERTRIDNRILGIGIHIRDREKVPMDADGPRLEAGNSAKSLRIFHAPGRANRHRVGKRRRPMQPVADPKLEIRRNQQRQLGIRLQPVEQLRRFERFIAIQKRRLIAHRHSKRSDVILVHGVAQLRVVGTVGIEKLRPRPDHEQLPNFFLHRHFVQSLLRPSFALAVEPNRQRLVLGFGKSGGG